MSDAVVNLKPSARHLANVTFHLPSVSSDRWFRHEASTVNPCRWPIASPANGHFWPGRSRVFHLHRSFALGHTPSLLVQLVRGCVRELQTIQSPPNNSMQRTPKSVTPFAFAKAAPLSGAADFRCYVSQMKALGEAESKLEGRWLMQGDTVVGDATCERIRWVISTQLKKIAVHPEFGAWETLFEDPDTNRHWVLTYPEGGLQGGGPPTLYAISSAEAMEIYGK